MKAGVMEPANAGVDRLRETQTVEVDPDRRPGWCFLVDPPNDEPYEVYSVHHLPEAPGNLSGDFEHQQHSTSGLKTATSRGDGIRPFCFDSHKGDPVCEYRVEVFINGTQQAERRLQVVP
ncbi:MAG: hypothetical protein A2Y95_02940 [Deltaproteobacteria bacterium RBG_13_65_10]|nr:MAG: hypothetical protein A2Y95_02940 [Deltaproteobacteria bacterium RBG_13_65_10]